MGSSESTLVKMPHCWKFHVVAHLTLFILNTCKQAQGSILSGYELFVKIKQSPGTEMHEPRHVISNNVAFW